MNYNECHKVIATYAPELLPQFADNWSRFPQGHAAHEIMEALNKKANTWASYDQESSRKIWEVKNTINERKGG